MARGVAMTVDEVARQLRAAGVDENVIAQEAATIAANYADADEDPQAVIDQVTPLYLQRSRSAGDRAAGGYSTDIDDPAASYGGVTAPARVDSAPLDRVSQAAAGGWFAAQMPKIQASGVTGGFGEDYTTPARPAHLQQPYQAPTWGETFTAPTAADLENEPGYLAAQAAIRRGMERGAAAQGSVLSGGFVGRTLPRALAEHAGTAYAGAHGRAFDSYRQRYGQFMDSANLGGQARSINEASYQGDVTNSLNQFLARRNAYQDAVGNNLNFARLGLDATLGGRP